MILLCPNERARPFRRLRTTGCRNTTTLPRHRLIWGREEGATRVLVVDQTHGDMSITCGLADDSSFARMLKAAQTEHPDAEIVIKTHPDVIAGVKDGYLTGPGGIHAEAVRIGEPRQVPDPQRVDQPDLIAGAGRLRLRCDLAAGDSKRSWRTDQWSVSARHSTPAGD